MISSLSFRAPPSIGSIQEMKEQLGELQIQLATGKRSQSLSDLGGQRMFNFALRDRLSDITAFESSITMIDLRITFMAQTMTRLEKIETETRAQAQAGVFDVSGENFPASQSATVNRLKEVLDLLNLEVNGRFLLSGTDTENMPVQTYDMIMDGEGTKAGFRTVAAERMSADLGTGNMGRTTVTTVGSNVAIAEDGTHPFGMKLTAVTAESGNLTLTQPTGAPPALAINFTGQPVEGEKVSITVTLPDGEVEVIEMNAVTAATGEVGDFVIGANTAATAANFDAAIKVKIAEFSQTKLAAASRFTAADNFFNKAGETSMRVSGTPATATSLTAATATDTMQWYSGDNLSTGIRQSISAKVNIGTQVSYGVQANEAGAAGLIRALAAFALEEIDPSDSQAVGRYSALNDGVRERMGEGNNSQPGSLEGVIVELGMIQVTLNTSKERHAQNEITLSSMLSEIEDINPEEVAMMMLSLRTRLEASYQSTSIIAQLSLVNYMR